MTDAFDAVRISIRVFEYENMPAALHFNEDSHSAAASGVI